MIRIVIQNDVADQIRHSNDQIELVDAQGQRLAVVRRPPSEKEIKEAKARIGSTGLKFTTDELIAKIEAL